MKILMIHTGGTISCAYENGVLSPRADIAPTVAKMFKNYRDVKTVHRHLCSVLSEKTDGKILNKIVSAVRKAVFSKKYDGVAVTVGSDALAYTSAAISYAIGLSDTPCTVVCSDKPLSSPGASGVANLKAAVAVIRSKKAIGALSVYPSHDGTVAVYRASRIMQQPAYFSTPVPVGELYGTVKDGEFSLSKTYRELPDAFKFEKPRFSTISPVAFLSVYPGMLYPTLPRKIKAVILGTYHSGTMDTDSAETVKFAKRCKKRGINVYVSGISDSADYESMTLYGELGFIRLPELSSPYAMLIKLWALNSQSKKFTDERLFSSLGGDITKESPKLTAEDNTVQKKVCDTSKPADSSAKTKRATESSTDKESPENKTVSSSDTEAD